jgi:hypothetical protein
MSEKTSNGILTKNECVIGDDHSGPKDYYAEVRWHACDVQSLTNDKNGKPRWTEEQSRVWLKHNQPYIQARLVELGWDVIRDLMPAKPNSKNYKE